MAPVACKVHRYFFLALIAITLCLASQTSTYATTFHCSVLYAADLFPRVFDKPADLSKYGFAGRTFEFDLESGTLRFDDGGAPEHLHVIYAPGQYDQTLIEATDSLCDKAGCMEEILTIKREDSDHYDFYYLNFLHHIWTGHCRTGR